jgi:hypothetical protein
MAEGTPSGNGPVSAVFSAVASNAVIAVSRYAGADTANPIGAILSGNTTGANGDCSNGVDNNFYSFNLTAALDGAMIYNAVTMRNTTHTPAGGFTERAELLQGSSGPIASLAVTDKRLVLAEIAAISGAFTDEVDASGVLLGRDNPEAFQLQQNYPNPFSTEASVGSPHTSINFSLPQTGLVTVRVYNEIGQIVRRLVTAQLARGAYQINWNGRNESGSVVAAGAYFYQIVIKDEQANIIFQQTRRMTLVK